MRKIVASLFVSLDGVMEEPANWHLAYWNDELGEAVGGMMADADAMLLGRITYQEFARHWAARTAEDDPGADFMNNSAKYVVSSTLQNADWNNSTVLTGPLSKEIAPLKQQAGGTIVVMGSGTLVRSLLNADLLDELRLLVHPVVVGRGKRLFAEADRHKRLDLIDAATFSTGVLALAYRPATGADG